MSIIIVYVTAYVHIWLTQNEEIKCHFRMAIKTQVCSFEEYVDDFAIHF